MSRAAAEAYKTQAIMTASPAKLVAMCFDRSIGALNDAIRAIEAGDVQRRFDNVTRATDILSHLWSTLDLERGGEIAQNLSNLYGFVISRLPDINIQNDPKPAREAISVLEPLAAAWNELARQGDAAGAQAIAAAASTAGARAAAARAPQAQQTPPASGGGLAISV